MTREQLVARRNGGGDLMAGICFCASGCALNPMTDPGAFGDDCQCWCHAGQRDRQQDQDGAQ